MQFLYVLTSSDADTFYEQFFLSVYSLRLHNPDAHIILLTDQHTKDGLTGTRSGYEKIISETKIIQTPVGLSQHEASRWIKTSMRDYASGDFLFIDCDTIITGELHFDFTDDMSMGAVLDKHSLISRHHEGYKILAYDEKAGFSSAGETGRHFNSGVIFCRDRPECHAFFAAWHRLWQIGNEKGVPFDQPSFNQANNQANYELKQTNSKSVITEIEGEWNCQIGYGGLAFLSMSKIIHYFSSSLVTLSSPFILASKDTFLAIKKSGAISDELQAMLYKPRGAFSTASRIIADTNALAVMDSSVFYKLLFIQDTHPAFFSRLDKVIAHMTRFVKIIFPQKKRIR